MTTDEPLDLWAVRVVVREGRYMPLSKEERILAAHLLSLKGFTSPQIAERLRMDNGHAAYHLLRGKPPMPLEEVDPTVYGPLVGGKV